MAAILCPTASWDGNVTEIKVMTVKGVRVTPKMETNIIYYSKPLEAVQPQKAINAQ